MDLWRSCGGGHPHIESIAYVYEDFSSLYILHRERQDFRDFMHAVASDNVKLRLYKVLAIVRQVALALHYLHERGYTHGRLKA